MTRKLLQVNKYYDPVVGGIETTVKQLAEGFAEKGNYVRVLAASQRWQKENYVQNEVQVEKVRTLGELLSVPIAPGFPLRNWQLSSKADLIHYHIPNPLAVCSNLLCPDEQPTVVTYHSDIVRQRRALRLYRPLLEQFLDAVDRIIVTSPPLLANSDVLSHHRDKCRIVPLGISEQKLNPGGVGTDNEDFTVLFVGRLVYYKGIQNLVESFDGIDGKLLIVGNGPLFGDLSSRIQESDPSSRIEMLGEVDDETLQRCYETADVFVLPSVARSEAFGIVQLEAMANGIPIINTDLPTGVPWVSQDGETGITVPPGDVEALREAIQQMKNHPEKRRQLGKAARERVKNQFTTESMIEGVDSVYLELL